MTQLTETQTRALTAFHRQGGEGVLDKSGWLVARGERIKFDTITWLRLVTLGMIEPAGPSRLRLTSDGIEAAKPAPVKVMHTRLDGCRHVPALEGAE